MSTPNPSPAALSEESRAQLLNAEVAKYAQRGWTVQSVAAGQAVVSKNKRIGWFWNLILVLLTGGLWLIYVIYRALNRKVQTVVITVDPAGRIRTS
jgi:activator of 2-hydroxyglutaryl-CoA dehydratase